MFGLKDSRNRTWPSSVRNSRLPENTGKQRASEEQTLDPHGSSPGVCNSTMNGVFVYISVAILVRIQNRKSTNILHHQQERPVNRLHFTSTS